MKKSYIAPSMQALSMEVCALICQSGESQQSNNVMLKQGTADGSEVFSKKRGNEEGATGWGALWK